MLDDACLRGWFLLLSVGIASCGADPHDTALAALPAPPRPASVTPTAGTGSAPPARAHDAAPFPDCEACAGTLTWELQAELTRRARGTKSCYDRMLSDEGAQKGGAGGRLMVRVRVGHKGNLCEEKVVLDEIRDEKLATCVRAAFAGEGAPLPAPAGGCIDVNVPLSFIRSDAGAGDSNDR
jgi:hypothetical protein